MFSLRQALLLAVAGGGAPGVRVTLEPMPSSITKTAGDTSTAIILQSSNGTISHTLKGTNTVDGNWLVTGANTDYDCRYTLVSGSTPNSGTTLNTWTQLSANCSCGYSCTAGQIKSGVVTVEIRDHTTLTVLATQNISIYCEAVDTGGGGCPFCCFTPDTRISMADGSQKRIADIVVGDRIRTVSGEVPVTEVIVREDRPMYRLEFSGGFVVDASEDHPFYVVGSGYASVNPTVPYKDIGIPGLLSLGDRVEHEDGDTYELLSVTPIEHAGKVYTLAESAFYANGLLVY